MQQWEYKIVDLEDGGFIGDGEEASEDVLNQLGEQGWELVESLTGSHTKLGSGVQTRTSGLVFKRPKE